MTYVRLSTLQGDPSKLEDGIELFRERAVATARQQRGFQGIQLLVDRRSGKGITLTWWENEAAAREAESALSQSRAEGGQRVGASNPTTEVLELVVNENA